MKAIKRMFGSGSSSSKNAADASSATSQPSASAGAAASTATPTAAAAAATPAAAANPAAPASSGFLDVLNAAADVVTNAASQATQVVNTAADGANQLAQAFNEGYQEGLNGSQNVAAPEAAPATTSAPVPATASASVPAPTPASAPAHAPASAITSTASAVVANNQVGVVDDLTVWRPWVSPPPDWAGKPLSPGQQEVGIVFAKADADFTAVIGQALRQAGLSVIWEDEVHVHEARACVIIFSDNTQLDDGAVRNCTRAFERYNANQVALFAVIAPYTTDVVLDNVPNNLAYALANTPFVDFKYNAKNPTKQFDFLYGMIKSWLTQSTELWDICGTWLCEVSLKGELGTTEWKARDFTFMLHHENQNVVGICAQGIDVKGTMVGTALELVLTKTGKWSSDSELWSDDDYPFTAKINGLVSLHGTYFEGTIEEKTKAGLSSGVIKATLQTRGISGYWQMHYDAAPGETEGHDEYMGIVHNGGLQITCDVRDFFGMPFNGFYDVSSGTVIFMKWYGGNNNVGMIGTHSKDTGEINLKAYGALFGTNLTGLINAVGKPYAFKEKPLKNLATLDLERFAGDSAQFYADEKFEKADYRTLHPGENATLIACTEHEKEQAEQLAKDLTEQKIGPITLDLNQANNSRSVIFLMSDQTWQSPQLINTIFDTADRGKPLYIVGLKLWADIFGDSRWDPALRDKLSVALARLNLTDVSALTKANPNFRTLVNKLRDLITPPKPNITNIWVQRNCLPDPHDDLDPSLLFPMVERDSVTLVAYRGKGGHLALTGKFVNFEMDVTAPSGDRMVLALNASQDVMHGTFYPVNGPKRAMTFTLNNTGVTGYYVIDNNQNDFIVISQLGTNTLFGFHQTNPIFGVVHGPQVVWLTASAAGFEIFCATSRVANGKKSLGGFSFTSELGSTTKPFSCDAFYGVIRVPDRGYKNQICSDKAVVQVVETYFTALTQHDYTKACTVIQDELIAQKQYTEKDFEDDYCNLVLTGPYVAIINYVGKLELTSIADQGATRHEFDIQFRDLPSERYVIKIKDNKITELWTLRDEALNYRTYLYDSMISYRSKDSDFIDLVMQYLDSRGLIVWRDRRMEIGSNWSNDIATAVRYSTSFIASISYHYIHSAPCTREVRMANEVSKVIVPLMLPPTEDKPSKQVVQHYPHDQPPLSIAREIAPHAVIDMRPLGHGKDATTLEEFIEKYNKPLKCLEQQLRNIQSTQSIYNIGGRWQVTLNQVLPESHSDEMVLLITHTSLITASAFLPKSKKSLILPDEVALVGALLDMALFSSDQTLLLSMNIKLGADGDSFEGTYMSMDFPACANQKRGRLTGQRALISDDDKQVVTRVACPDAWAQDKTDLFWHCWTIGDYDLLRTVLMSDELAKAFDPKVFEPQRVQHVQEHGEFIYSSFTAIVQTKNGLSLYEFSSNFTKTKNFQYYFVFDNNQKISFIGDQDDIDKAREAGEI